MVVVEKIIMSNGNEYKIKDVVEYPTLQEKIRSISSNYSALDFYQTDKGNVFIDLNKVSEVFVKKQ